MSFTWPTTFPVRPNTTTGNVLKIDMMDNSEKIIISDWLVIIFGVLAFISSLLYAFFDLSYIYFR